MLEKFTGKRISALLACILCLSCAEFGFTQDEHEYIGQRHWRLMAEGEKAFYLQGLIDGVFYLDDSFRAYKQLDWNRLTINNIVLGLNEFYADFRNQNIPVPVATLLVRLKIIGEDPKVIEQIRQEFLKR